ncbi:SPOR domain-containing protein [Paenibacillus shunpengii]|uniref:SPOR domain-containing protein n=1 Tax=Paenibacillus shunpengii TaxID=2054424 RepID=A0ABW5SWW5_9BACL|nr:SPOR domain-containing protein [Paenibacillus sp. PDC88]SDX52745.1 stage II sporulation protein B [Paenibacillus sp. PDC88]
MNKARMTFRFNEDKPAAKLESDIVMPGDEWKHSKERTTAKHDITDPVPAEMPQTTIPLQTVTSLPLDEREEGRSDRDSFSGNNVYADQRIYEDWEEPFGSYSSVPIVAGHEHYKEPQEKDKQHPGSYEELEDQDPFYLGQASENYTMYRGPRNVWKMTGSIIAAVVTGVMFGFVAMSMVNSENTSNTVSPVTVPASSGVTQETVTEGGANVPAGASSAATIPAVTYYMLQYGVFSSPEGAEQAKAELTSAGIAAGSDPLDELRVYAGVSADRENAKLISNQLRTEGVELYVREIHLPEITGLQFSGDQSTVTDFFNSSRAITEILTSVSIRQLGQQEQKALSEADMNAVTDAHQRWTSTVAKIRSGLPAESESVELQMEAAMNTAVTAVAEYNKNPSKEHIWKVQSQVMNYILLEKQLLEIIKQA